VIPNSLSRTRDRAAKVLDEEDEDPGGVEDRLRGRRFDQGAGLDGERADQDLRIRLAGPGQSLGFGPRVVQLRQDLFGPFRFALRLFDDSDQHTAVELVDTEPGEQVDAAGQDRVDLRVQDGEGGMLAPAQGLDRPGGGDHHQIDLAVGETASGRIGIVGLTHYLDAAPERLAQVGDIRAQGDVLLVGDDQGAKGLGCLPVAEAE
jgi:hypothetical protein